MVYFKPMVMHLSFEASAQSEALLPSNNFRNSLIFIAIEPNHANRISQLPLFLMSFPVATLVSTG